ncbi:protein kinase [Streptomyces sp. NBC_00249]|uniref:protein kinase domain-containing protein n=1 Tax=Streptomyces sp. NBC_00249 TaxID=2975690 RepID=UPI00224DAF4F|nr:protein kinase [Streptomyces sp. NBC_00249]MCX5193688.1 protein kinase [Streptomyces sp. NBC_00249]
MPLESPGVLQERYWLDRAWEEHGPVTYWSAYDQRTGAEVFVQQLRPLGGRMREDRTWPPRRRLPGDRSPAALSRKGASGKRASGKEPSTKKPAAKGFSVRGFATKPGPTDTDTDTPLPPGSLLGQVRRVEDTKSAHLLAVHDAFEQDGALWVVMDPVQPRSLDRLMREQGRLDGAGAAFLGAEMAAGLRELHAAGLAYGQLTPHNVFLRADRTLALAGYGLLPAPDGDHGPWVRPWRPDSPYTAPELADRRTDRPPAPTPSGDLWAMGMVLYEILAGSGSLLYGPLRKFRWVRTIHDARPPRIAKERELSLLLALLLSPHSGARSSAGTAEVTLSGIAEQHEPMAAGHWAVANRRPKSLYQHLRDTLVQFFTTVTSRVVAAFLSGVLVTVFGWHLVSRPSAPNVETALVGSVLFGLAYGIVQVLARAGLNCWALMRGRPWWPGRRAGPAAAAEGPRPAGPPPQPQGRPAAAPPPRLPACTPRLTMRDAPARVGRPVRLEFVLDVPPGHPWHRPAGDTTAPAELVLVASTLAAGADIVPASRGYRPQDPEEGPAAFEFTARTPGRHVLRITVFERVHGVVLQELNATLEVEEPALLAPARHDPAEF